MFEAQYLVTDQENGVTVFGPWMPRTADNITYMVDIKQIGGAGNLTVELYEKNLEDTDDGTLHSGATTGTLSSTGVTSQDVTGVKELVRYRYTAKAPDDGTLMWVLFRMLPPVWYDAVEV